jgi:stage V sporulation protein D (sporulation-specific penicillin-binding protein)
VVSEFTDPSGAMVEKHEPKVTRQVVSEETAALVTAALEEVVRDGTGRNAYVAGYRTGGKTGTSQKKSLRQDEQEGKYVVSFIGFAPIEDPTVAVLVALDEPGGPVNLRSGGQMAAPVVGRIMSDILPYIGLQPQYSAEDLAGREEKTPTLKGLDINEAIAVLRKNDLKFRVEGEGKTVVDQLPIPGVIIPATAQVVLYTESERPDGLVVVPNVIGKTPEQANRLIVDAGLYMRVSGATSTYSSTIEATSQDVKSGAEVALGTVVSVEFRDMSIND